MQEKENIETLLSKCIWMRRHFPAEGVWGVSEGAFRVHEPTVLPVSPRVWIRAAPVLHRHEQSVWEGVVLWREYMRVYVVIESIMSEFKTTSKLARLQRLINKCFTDLISFLKSELASKKNLISNRMREHLQEQPSIPADICKRC